MMEIGAALAGMKGALDLARVALDARDDAKAKAAVADMTSKFIDTQNSVIALQDRVQALQAQLAKSEAQLAKLNQRQAERDQYALHEITRGGFAYIYSPSSSDTRGVGPHHYVCQPCFDKGVKAVLTVQDSAIGWFATCPVCRVEIALDSAGGR